MGSLLLTAGAKGKRYILPNATVMIHQPSGGYSGVAEDIAIHAKEVLPLDVEKTNLDPSITDALERNLHETFNETTYNGRNGYALLRMPADGRKIDGKRLLFGCTASIGNGVSG